MNSIFYLVQIVKCLISDCKTVIQDVLEPSVKRVYKEKFIFCKVPGIVVKVKYYNC